MSPPTKALTIPPTTMSAAKTPNSLGESFQAHKIRTRYPESREKRAGNTEKNAPWGAGTGFEIVASTILHASLALEIWRECDQTHATRRITLTAKVGRMVLSKFHAK